MINLFNEMGSGLSTLSTQVASPTILAQTIDIIHANYHGRCYMWTGPLDTITTMKSTLHTKYGVSWIAGRCDSTCVTFFETHGAKGCKAGEVNGNLIEKTEIVHYIAINKKACL